MSRALSGADLFNLLVDRKMIRTGLAGNISRIHVKLSGPGVLERLYDQLLRNNTLQVVARLRVVHRWPLLPRWKECKGSVKPVEVLDRITPENFQREVLNRKVCNKCGLVYIDLCRLTDGSEHVVIHMHHVLFDHQGMVNFVHALADQDLSFPLFPERRKVSLWSRASDPVRMTWYMLSRANPHLGSLTSKRVAQEVLPGYREIILDTDGTCAAEAEAVRSGARISKTVFGLSVAAKCLYELLLARGKHPPYLWFSVPHNKRKRGGESHLISNELSYFFFRVYPAELGSVKDCVASINRQLKEQIEGHIADRYMNLADAMRHVPMPVYEAMIDLASKGKMSSFGYSDLGVDKLLLDSFQGVPVAGVDHYPPVPTPPGISLVAMKEHEQLRYVIAYHPEAVTSEEMSTFQERFRELLT